MPRSSRMIIPDQPTVYHVMSRTALEGLPFQAFDKDKMLEIIQQFSRLYFVEILGFCIMDNHFHCIVRMIPDTHFTDDDIRARFVRFHGEEALFPEGNQKATFSIDYYTLSAPISLFFSDRKKETF